MSRESKLEAKAILAFEKSGNLRDLDATGDFAWFEESYKETPIERLAGALCPSEEEREVLCTDLNEETATLAKALQDLLGLSDSDASAPAYQDPWENEPARAPRRRGERGQGLSIVNALGVAPRAVEAPDGEPSPAPGQATFKLQLVTETVEGRTESVAEIATFSRRAQSIENVGMTLEESKGVPDHDWAWPPIACFHTTSRGLSETSYSSEADIAPARWRNHTAKRICICARPTSSYLARRSA